MFGWFRKENGTPLNMSARVDMAADLRHYLSGQIDELSRINVKIGVNPIAAAYILGLLAVSRKNEVDLGSL